MAGDFDINDADFAADAKIDSQTEAVERVRHILAANADMEDDDDTAIVGVDSFTYGDLRALLAAYDRARAALRRVRDGVEEMTGIQYGFVDRVAVIALIDREATDA